MLRFFIFFMGIQLTLFGINMLGWIQQHLVRRAKGVAQARGIGLQGLREIDARCYGQNRLLRFIHQR